MAVIVKKKQSHIRQKLERFGGFYLAIGNFHMKNRILFLHEKLEILNLETEKTKQEIDRLQQEDFKKMFVYKKTRLRLRTKLKAGKFTPLEKGKFLALHSQGWKLSDIAKELSRSIEDLQEIELKLEKLREKVKRCKKTVTD
jgi:hypothetical protein